MVDDLEVDVYAFGLITDFRGQLFEGTKRMLEIADERVPLQVEARCWCGARATHNARVVNGFVVYEGETVVVGDTADPGAQKIFGDIVRYELLCRRHYNLGELGWVNRRPGPDLATLGENPLATATRRGLACGDRTGGGVHGLGTASTAAAHTGRGGFALRRDRRSSTASSPNAGRCSRRSRHRRCCARRP